MFIVKFILDEKAEKSLYIAYYQTCRYLLYEQNHNNCSHRTEIKLNK